MQPLGCQMKQREGGYLVVVLIAPRLQHQQKVDFRLVVRDFVPTFYPRFALVPIALVLKLLKPLHASPVQRHPASEA